MNVSYGNDFDITVSNVQKVMPMLNNEGCTSYLGALEARDLLVSRFMACSENKEWIDFSNDLEEFGKNPLARSIINCHWEEGLYKSGFPNMEGPSKKNILVRAIELGAPSTLIKLLIEHGAQIDQLHPRTPSPFLMVCTQLIRRHRALERELLELDLEALLAGNEIYDADYPGIGDIINVLCAHKASLNSSFCIVDNKKLDYKRSVTPFSLVAEGTI